MADPSPPSDTSKKLEQDRGLLGTYFYNLATVVDKHKGIMARPGALVVAAAQTIRDEAHKYYDNTRQGLVQQGLTVSQGTGLTECLLEKAAVEVLAVGRTLAGNPMPPPPKPAKS
jgi:hypothetical protein